MPRYRKKPIEIEAIQWTGQNLNKIVQSNFSKYGYVNNKKEIIIQTFNSNVEANINDWIIKGIKGEFYSCKPDIFEATYEPV